MGTEAFLEHLQSLPWYCRQVVHCQRMPARRAMHAEPAAQLAPTVLGALRARGVGQLFSHQAQAVDLLLKVRSSAGFLALLCMPGGEAVIAAACARWQCAVT